LFVYLIKFIQVIIWLELIQVILLEDNIQ
jgi:hypothetical protein